MSIEKTQALQGQQRNRTCSLPSSGTPGLGGTTTSGPYSPTVQRRTRVRQQQRQPSTRAELLCAGTPGAHGSKDPNDHAAHIQDETRLSPPRRTLSSRPDCSTCGVPGLTGLHSGTVSQKEESGLGESASPETAVGCNMPPASLIILQPYSFLLLPKTHTLKIPCLAFLHCSQIFLNQGQPETGNKPSVATHAYNPRTQEAEAGGLP